VTTVAAASRRSATVDNSGDDPPPPIHPERRSFEVNDVNDVTGLQYVFDFGVNKRYKNKCGRHRHRIEEDTAKGIRTTGSTWLNMTSASRPRLATLDCVLVDLGTHPADHTRSRCLELARDDSCQMNGYENAPTSPFRSVPLSKASSLGRRAVAGCMLSR